MRVASRMKIGVNELELRCDERGPYICTKTTSKDKVCAQNRDHSSILRSSQLLTSISVDIYEPPKVVNDVHNLLVEAH